MRKIMPTAAIHVSGDHGKSTVVRSLIDTASTSNFMTKRLAESLGLNIKKSSTPVQALENLSTKSQGSVSAKIHSRILNFERELTFQIISSIADRIPSEPIDRGAINIPKRVPLADPEFHVPAPVDILLDVETALSILCVGQRKYTDVNSKSELCIQKTLLGWIIGGSLPTPIPPQYGTCMLSTESQLDLANFWELTDGPTEKHLSHEEIICEKHFVDNVSRDKEGRYVVALPFNEKKNQLGESKGMAKKRLEGTMRKLSTNPELSTQYHHVLNEYITLGHMTPLSNEKECTPGYYLPHHAVIKTDSLTTKVRVVFDGSAKTTTGLSLNDTLMVGPTIQSDLFSLLIRFRLHNIVITADIEKMYRQFWIRPEDRQYQRILWKNSQGEFQTFELNTVTFGLSAAPFLAIRSLHQLAEDEENNFPLASRVLKEDLYVDDVLTGAATREEAIELRDQLTNILKRAGLNIRQWASNDSALFCDLPPESINLQLQSEENTTIKTLGIRWDPRRDKIIYTVKLNTQNKQITKRHILSETARIFDPLGLLAPVIVIAKIIMQKLWALKLEWDESLPESLYSEWKEYYKGLASLEQISFDRRSLLPEAQRVELHGFCDASERAYGACLYTRSIDSNGQIITELLAAKTKVAPLKTISIPRLELCEALLLTTLYKTVKNAMPRVDDTIFWTDSTIVLGWIRTSPQKLQTFVANRVAEIQRSTDTSKWRHVRTHENPADLLSRGQSPEELLNAQIWRNGPSWLHSHNVWPNYESPTNIDLPEMRKETCFHTEIQSANKWTESLLNRYSSFDKLQRVVAYLLRFKPGISKQRMLSTGELENARKIIIRLTQNLEFGPLIEKIKKKRELPENSKIRKLNPFIDQEGILRVGGRLRNSVMPYSERHPIILPKNNHITNLIIQREHKLHYHGGTQTTLYAIRRRYWPIDGRSQIWKVLRNCVICCKAQPHTPEYIMGDLPTSRVTESRPFTHVGIDYCGPFFLKERKFRNLKKVKAYVAVFVCMATKAAHLEVVSDLTTDSFIAALRRFMARRGFCTNIYSDNGTNFVGANNYLRDLHNLLKTEECQNQIKKFASSKQIEWHFSPARSPHFGGLWEAAVKIFKRHLVRIAGIEMAFTFEEFNTLIIEIEAILNSRPLTPISNDPNDLNALTPGHFFIGESLTSLRDRDISTLPTNRLSVWQHLLKLKENFWTRWKNEYLNELTCRQKWVKGSHTINLNSMVLLRDDNLPSLTWPLGRVIEIHPGADGIIRAVSVRTSKGIVKRGIKAIALLPIDEPNLKI